MKNEKKENDKTSFSSFKDYQKNIFPSIKNQTVIRVDDPYIYGIELANSSRQKLKSVLK